MISLFYLAQNYMASRKDEPLLADLDGGKPSPTRAASTRKPSRRPRSCPILALLGLVLHLLVSGCGVAISVLVAYFNLQVAALGLIDLIGRILLFAASCMGVLYVLMHAGAARAHYDRTRPGARVSGFFTVAVALVMLWLSLLVWIGSVVVTAFVAVNKGFDLDEGLNGNVIFIQLGIASLGLISLILMVIITESTQRPFATAILSKRSFIRGTSPLASSAAEDQRSVLSRESFRASRDEETKGGHVYDTSHEMMGFGFERLTACGFDRRPGMMDTPEPVVGGGPLTSSPPDVLSPGPHDKDRRLRRVRSQPFPSPVLAAFVSRGIPSDDEPRVDGTHLAWRPPVRTPTPQVMAPPGMAQIMAEPRLLSQSQFMAPPQSTTQPQIIAQPQSTAPPPSRAPPPVKAPPPTTATPSLLTGPRKIAPAPSAPAVVARQQPPRLEVSPVVNNAPPSLRLANPDPVSPPTPTPTAAPESPVPTLAKLLGQLSTRAAARRRNSMLNKQQGDIIPPVPTPPRQAWIAAPPASRPSIAPTTRTQSNFTSIFFDQPADFGRPTLPRNSLAARQAELHPRRSLDFAAARNTYYTPEDDDDDYYTVEIPRPGTAPRGGTINYEDDDYGYDDYDDDEARPLQPRGEDAPRQVRNFSRPGTAVWRPSTAGSVFGGGGGWEGMAAAAVRPATADDRRRSRSLPPRGRGERLGRKGSVSAKYSPFPKLETTTTSPTGGGGAAGVVGGGSAAKPVKGLGQGSGRRLDERVALWREDVGR